MTRPVIAIAVFLLLVLGITTRSQVVQWFHHLGYYRYISNNTVEIAPTLAELEQREQYYTDLAQYQRDKFKFDDMLAAERIQNPDEEEPQGTFFSHPPEPPKPPPAITKHMVLTNQGLWLLPMFSTELDHCVVIYSKDEDLKSKKIAQIVVENHYTDSANVDRTDDVTVWAETQNIVPAGTSTECQGK